MAWRAAVGASLLGLALTACLDRSPDAPQVDAGLDAGAVPDDPSFASVAAAVENLLAASAVPGAAIAVTHDGRLVFAKAYGVVDVETTEPTRVGSRFRLASLSKLITAVAVLKLVEEGRIALDAPAVDYLQHLPPPAGTTPDPRLQSIRVRDLLQHSSGWFTPGYASGDPETEVPEVICQVAATMGVTCPADAQTLVRYFRGHVQLARDPGIGFAYANINFVVLARIVEGVTGQPYESYVRTAILAPMGIDGMAVGDTRRANRLEGEVAYHDPSGQLITSIYPDETEPVPWPYGGWDLAAMDAAGGWVASVVDYARLLVSIDGEPSVPDLLAAATLDAMVARPSFYPDTYTYWYGLGVSVHTAPAPGWLEHDGGLHGTCTRFVLSREGYAVVLFLNSIPRYPPSGLASMSFSNQVATIFDAVAESHSSRGELWPTTDLFATLD